MENGNMALKSLVTYTSGSFEFDPDIPQKVIMDDPKFKLGQVHCTYIQ